MSRYYRKDTRDANHGEIVDGIRGRGIYVVETERPVDLLLYANGWTGWAEVKTAERDAAIRRSQLEFMAFTPMPVRFVKSLDEALEFVRTGIGLSQKEKDKLAAFLHRDSRSKYWPAIVEKVLAA